jgi:NADP-dependent 3-hydroxy acid dehydrogenase YdfG
MCAVLITGCSSGIGIETARAMKATGAHVIATARDLNKGKKALADSECSRTLFNMRLPASP